MKPYFFLSEAKRELESAADRLAESGESRAERFLDEVREAIDRVRAFPEIGSEVGEGYRRWPIPRYHYDLIHREARTAIVILAIAHQHRAPGYWIPRIETDEVQEPKAKDEIRKAWDEEIARRLAAYDRGEVSAEPHEDVMKNLRRKLEAQERR